MAYVENRTPERYFVSRQNREAVPRPKFLTKNFESRAILSIIFCPGGGIGRRTRLKIELRKECGFDSHPGHHKRTKRLFQSQKVGRAKRVPLISPHFSKRIRSTAFGGAHCFFAKKQVRNPVRYRFICSAQQKEFLL